MRVQTSESKVVGERSLAEKAYRFIYELLASGQLPPGARLVNRALAKDIGVSVIPVREAIHRLASEGLVEHVPGSGAFVPDRSVQDLSDLYVLRDALESCAAEEASRHITDFQLEQLQDILLNMQEVERSVARRESKHATTKLMNQWLDGEQRFHEILIESSRNTLLSKVIREHRAISRVFDVHRDDPSILTAEVADQTCRDRAELLEALEGRNPERSRELMSQQIRQGRRTLMKHLSRSGKSERTS